MNIIFCTFFNLNRQSAGLTRVFKLRDSVKKYGINIIIAGSGLRNTSKNWDTFDNEFGKLIFYNESKFECIKHSNFLKILQVSSNFYSSTLDDLTNIFNLSGAIVYAPFGKNIAPLLKKKKNNFFLIADCGEFYNFTFKFLLNGVMHQQFYFRFFQMKKISGVIVPSPIWYKTALKLKLKKLFLPGAVNSNNLYRKNISKNKEVKIVFMGRLLDREMPNTIIESLKICKINNLKFQLILIGVKKETFKERYWLKKIKKEKILMNSIKILGYISDAHRDEILANADLHIMLRPNNNETKFLFPSRVPEFLMSANPVILTKTHSMNFYFKENYGAKFISNLNDPEELANLITNLSLDPKKRFKIGQLGREYARKFYSIDNMGYKLSKFLNSFNQSISSL